MGMEHIHHRCLTTRTGDSLELEFGEETLVKRLCGHPAHRRRSLNIYCRTMGETSWKLLILFPPSGWLLCFPKLEPRTTTDHKLCNAKLAVLIMYHGIETSKATAFTLRWLYNVTAWTQEKHIITSKPCLQQCSIGLFSRNQGL